VGVGGIQLACADGVGVGGSGDLGAQSFVFDFVECFLSRRGLCAARGEGKRLPFAHCQLPTRGASN